MKLRGAYTDTQTCHKTHGLGPKRGAQADGSGIMIIVALP